MKQILLATTFLLFAFIASAQTKEGGCGNCYGSNQQNNNNYNYNTQDNGSVTIDLKIYPNPATEYIGLNDNDAVGKIVIFNLVGKKMKSFDYVKGETFLVSDLLDGMYLVQLVGKNNKILTTQRLSKK